MAVDRAIILRLNPSGHELVNISQWNPAVLTLVNGAESPEPIPTPELIRPDGIINLFGVCVYAFMCHHSITPLITPIRNKKNLMFRLSLPLFSSVLLLNLAISGTAVVAFNHVADLYTLNFIPDDQYIETSKLPALLVKIIGYFLSLFPTFVFISVFPIIGTTLLNNLFTLISLITWCRTPRMPRLQRYGMPFLVLLLPISVALGTDNVGLLVGFTGAFAGTGMQYVIPAFLVYKARRGWTEHCSRFKGGLFEGQVTITDWQDDNIDDPLATESVHVGDRISSEQLLPDCYPSWKSPYASPFQHIAWIVLLICWAVLTVILVAVDRIYSLVRG